MPAVITGIVNASAGGAIRQEIYFTAIVRSSASYVTSPAMGAGPIAAALIATPLGFASRALAIVQGLVLPSRRF